MTESYDIILHLFFPIVLIVAILAMFITAYDEAYLQPSAAETAQQLCIVRGFDNYRSFERTFLSTNPLGVRCMYESRNIFEGSLDLSGDHPVSEIQK